METIENFRGGAARPRTFPDRTDWSVLEVVLATLVRWAEMLGRAAARRRTIGLLHALDDRTLNDIGVKRGDIEAVVREPSRWRRS